MRGFRFQSVLKSVACGAAGPFIAYSVDIGLKGLRAG